MDGYARHQTALGWRGRKRSCPARRRRLPPCAQVLHVAHKARDTCTDRLGSIINGSIGQRHSLSGPFGLGKPFWHRLRGIL